jgi:MFS-type transporter involved in bile tolerance (Atg22 family)
MFAMLALAGDLGCSLGPVTVGLVSGDGDLRKGLTAAAVFPLLLIAGLLVLRRQRAKSA